MFTTCSYDYINGGTFTGNNNSINAYITSGTFTGSGTQVFNSCDAAHFTQDVTFGSSGYLELDQGGVFDGPVTISGGTLVVTGNPSPIWATFGDSLSIEGCTTLYSSFGPSVAPPSSVQSGVSNLGDTGTLPYVSSGSLADQATFAPGGEVLNNVAGATQAAALAAEAASGAATQLTTDQAAVTAAAGSIIRPADGGVTILSQSGTFDLAASNAAATATGAGAQVATDQAAVTAAAPGISRAVTLLGVAGQAVLTQGDVQAATAGVLAAAQAARAAAAAVLARDGGGAGAISSTLTLMDSGGTPVANAEVWVTTDPAGTNVVAGRQSTGDLGQVTVFLDAGDYYRWAVKAGMNFANPQVFTVA